VFELPETELFRPCGGRNWKAKVNGEFSRMNMQSLSSPFSFTIPLLLRGLYRRPETFPPCSPFFLFPFGAPILSSRKKTVEKISFPYGSSPYRSLRLAEDIHETLSLSEGDQRGRLIDFLFPDVFFGFSSAKEVLFPPLHREW